jgi:hypothetical protein
MLRSAAAINLVAENIMDAFLSPTSAPSATAADERQDKQKQNGADRGIDDGGNDSGSKSNTELRQQPAADECAKNPENEIPDQAKSSSAHDLTGEPPGDDANHEDDEKTFTGHVHANLA